MSDCDLVNFVMRGIAAQTASEFAAARLKDADRPIGTKALDIDFYSAADRDRPIEDGSMIYQGRRVQWKGARWCVVLVSWDGQRWKRVRRITGPLNGVGAALTRRGELCKTRGLLRKDDA